MEQQLKKMQEELEKIRELLELQMYPPRVFEVDSSKISKEIIRKMQMFGNKPGAIIPVSTEEMLYLRKHPPFPIFPIEDLHDKKFPSSNSNRVNKDQQSKATGEEHI